MATFYVEEYANIVDPAGGGDNAQVPGELLAIQKITVAASSARTSSNFNALTKYLIVSTDTVCQFELGDGTVTADGDSRPLYANTYRAVALESGNTRIAVIEQQ